MIDGSSIIGALGVGSGVNMARLASDLSQAQFAVRQERLVGRGEQLDRQISAASSLKNSLSVLASSLGDRVRTGDLATRAIVANSSLAEAKVAPGTKTGSQYSLEVMQLAAAQSLVSPIFASGGTAMGGGSITIRFGTIADGRFVANPQQTFATIALADDATLEDVAQAVNRASTGVTAYLVPSGGGTRLMLKGEDGANSGFIIETEARSSQTVNPILGGDSSTTSPLAQLAWEPQSGDATRLTARALDARYRLDGLERTSASNTLGEVAPGLSLKLTGALPGVPTTISLSNPTASIAASMQDLVGALNTVASDLRTAMAPNTGDLSSDPGARLLRTKLSRLAGEAVMPNAANDAPRTLSDLGLVIERDGSFRLDADRLQATLRRDPAGSAAMFGTGLHGVYATFDRLARAASRSGDPGSLGGSIARFTRLAANVTERREELTGKEEALRTAMIARFAKADTRVTASQSTLSFLQAQIEVWNGESR